MTDKSWIRVKKVKGLGEQMDLDYIELKKKEASFSFFTRLFDFEPVAGVLKKNAV